MKIKISIFTTLFYLLWWGISNAQPLPPATANPLQFNTGINSSFTNSMNVGSWSNWGVSLSNPGIIGPNTPISPPGLAAMVTSNSNACSWANQMGSSYPFSMWVTYPSFGCSNGTTSYSCNPTWNSSTQSAYFYKDFTLNSPVYFLSWQVFASGFVEAIWVNGVAAYTTAIVNPTITPSHYNFAIGFNWCENFRTGSNRVTIKVSTNPSWAAQCKHLGLQVISWGIPSSFYTSVSGPSIACTGQTYTYTTPNKYTLPIANPAMASYTWTKPAGWGAGGTNTNVITFTAGKDSGVVAAHIFSVGAGGNKVCLATSGFSVIVPPPLTITPTSSVVCAGNTLNLSATGGTNYIWYKQPGLQFIGNGPTITVTQSLNTTYVVKATTTVGSCSYSRAISIPVLPPPIVSVQPVPATICQGLSSNLMASGSALTYSWTAPINTIAMVINVTPSATTVYSMVGIGANGCRVNRTATVNVLPNPNLTVSATPSVVCAGVSSTLNAVGAPTINWSPPNTTVNPLVVTPAVTTTYAATGTQTNGCTRTSGVVVTVFQLPIVTANPAFICTGTSNTLIGSGAMIYNWYIGGPTPSTIINTPSIVITPTAVTPYTLCGTGANNCSACVTGTLTFGTPVPITAPNVTVCLNGGPCTSLTASSSMGGATYTWMPGSLFGSTVTSCVGVNTIYTVNATSPLGCPNSATVDLKAIMNCCPVVPPGISQITTLAGVITNNSFLLDNSMTLSNNTIIKDADVYITPGVQITVPPGLYLDLENAHLFACGNNMWQGIKVMDGGRITTNNTRKTNSLIEDAEVAIEFDSMNSANVVPGAPAIDVHRVIFNKNYVGIKIGNSDAAMDSLALGITGCVFTSRQMTFATSPFTFDWPSSDNALPGFGVRFPATPTTGLLAPYTNLNNFPITNLKQPHQTQPGHIGIQIENIGDPNGQIPTPGVQFGITYLSWVNPDFNLFDGIGVGIDVKESSLTTVNNVFQNMQRYNTGSGWFGGTGIDHKITGLRNARCSLKPVNNTSDGNQFWDCYKGVKVENVFEFWVYNALFRSDHNVGTALLPLGTTPGDIGIEYLTNRFSTTIRESEFNNLRYGILFETPTTPQLFEMSGMSGAQLGIYAGGMSIERNYFGPQVTSTAVISNEYMSDAIVMNTPNTFGWLNDLSNGFISSNKVNRAFRGFTLDGLEDYTLAVSANEMLIENDIVYGSVFSPAKGWGISATNKMDNLTVANNTLVGILYPFSSTNNSISLVYCENNYGAASPEVRCNWASDAMFGYEFSAANNNTRWLGNEMCNLFGGLALTNSAVIGPQGSSIAGHGNWWSNACAWPWGAINNTYVDNSTPSLSPLYVLSPSPTYDPIIHFNAAGSTPYANGITVLPVSLNVIQDCVNLHAYIPTPSWRSAGATDVISPEIEEAYLQQAIQLYPNPSNGQLLLKSTGKDEVFGVKVFDITGKLVFSNPEVSGNDGELNLQNLPASIYFVEINTNETKTIRKKIIIQN